VDADLVVIWSPNFSEPIQPFWLSRSIRCLHLRAGMSCLPCFSEGWCKSKFRVMRFNGGHGVAQNACYILVGCSTVEESHSKRMAIGVGCKRTNAFSVKRCGFSSNLCQP
jgi:hypothetical protein